MLFQFVYLTAVIVLVGAVDSASIFQLPCGGVLRLSCIDEGIYKQRAWENGCNSLSVLQP